MVKQVLYYKYCFQRFFNRSQRLMNKILFYILGQKIRKPIFIIGCGRSGTTILGTALSMHRKITYLNERRDLWFKAYPKTDIWTDKAHSRNGKMVLKSGDTEKKKNTRPPKQKPIKLTFKQAREFENLPDIIENLEKEIAYLHEEMADPSFYKQDAQIITDKKNKLDSLEAELTASYDRWEKLAAIDEIAEKK